jgi:hypothetical protein
VALEAAWLILLRGCVVGVAVPRRTRGVRLFRTLRSVQCVWSGGQSEQAGGESNVALAQKLTRPPPGLFFAEEPTGTLESREKCHVYDHRPQI